MDETGKNIKEQFKTINHAVQTSKNAQDVGLYM